MSERLKKSTKCPRCKEELDDDDGCFFDDFSGIKRCNHCDLELQYIKQMKRDINNPYCDYVWNKTFLRWE